VKYNDLILESLKKTALKRVRIKVDPSKMNREADLSKIDGYEGYILEECADGNLKILVLSPEMSIHDLSPDMIQAVVDDDAISDDEPDSLDELKEFIIMKLMASGKNPNDINIQKIVQTQNLDEIEQHLAQLGIVNDELADLYRDFITHEN